MERCDDSVGRTNRTQWEPGSGPTPRRTDGTSGDQCADVPRRVLTRVLEGLDDPPPRADENAMRFARICVLDEMALVSGTFEKSPPTERIRRDHGSVRTHAALRAIAARLSRELAQVPLHHSGYRSGIAFAIDHIAETRSGLIHGVVAD